MAEKVRSYRDLKVWRKAMDLTESTYRLTGSFPRRETYGLASQLQRCAVSVASNIAEGHGRGTTGDYLRFLSIALGSLAEFETQILIAARLGYLPQEALIGFMNESDELGRMLRGLHTKLAIRKRSLAPSS